MCTTTTTSEVPAGNNGEKAEDSTAPPWPEDFSETITVSQKLRHLYQTWTYSYMGSLLKKGSQQTAENRLTQNDLYRVPQNLEVTHLVDRFHEMYDGHDSSESTTTLSSSSSWRLLQALFHVAAPTFIPAGFCELLSILCQVALPLLVRELLQVLEENPNSQVLRQGLSWSLAIFACAVLNSFANHRHRHLALKSGIAIRAAAVRRLYEHVLRLSPKGRSGLTSGEVTNLIGTDTQKLYEVCQEGHLAWALPLAIVLVTICLLLVMGPTTLVGVAVLIMFVPLVERVTTRMLQIRHKRVARTDERVNIVGALLQGIKVTKLNSYERKYEGKVRNARNKELSHLKKELAVWALSLVLTVTSPGVAAGSTFAVYVLIDDGNYLTASRAFSVLLLFSALRFPINFAGRLLGKATQAYSAVQRIARFLDREVRAEHSPAGAYRTDEPPLVLQNAAFFARGIDKLEEAPGLDTAEGPSEVFQVSKFDVSVRRGEVLAVCGPVGGGKSTLVNGIVGETQASPESVVRINGKVSLVSQDAFILNNTLRENILFGSHFDPELYERVIHASCLAADLDIFGSDLIEIGERGVTLSGGQKSRVSLARAAYAQPDLVVLDDPLSALDAGTSKKVFERLIEGSDAVFADAAVVLVTHASHFLNRVDSICVIVDGMNVFGGTWNELLRFQAEDGKTATAIDFLRLSVQESDKKTENTLQAGVPEEGASMRKKEGDVLMTIEEREHGLSSPKAWLLWFKHAGGIPFLTAQIGFMAVDRFAYVAVEYWLARWTQAVEDPINVFGIEFAPQEDGIEAQYQFLVVYSSIILVSVLATIIRSEWSVTGGARAAKKVFAAMLHSVLGSPMSYFETCPMGRILNRMVYDTEVIDVNLTQNMSMFMISTSWYFAGVGVMVSIIPWMCFAIVPVTVIYWVLLLHYRKSGSDLQRLDAVSRSPMQAMVSEGLDGSAAIRLFGQQSKFVGRFASVADDNSAALLNFVSAQRWLGFRIELLGSVVVLAASIFIISMNGILRIDAGLAGLLIVWSSNFTITLGFLVDTFAEAEAAITAIERVDAMSCLPQESAGTSKAVETPPPDWPDKGDIEFRDVRLRYRDGLPLALQGLTFRIPAGNKCGIVGRTGAGKSTLTVALFRLVEIESGQILLDGIDLSRLELQNVRGRPGGMAIIPQDPFLAGGTLRECIDPFGNSTDADILEALKAVRLADSSDDIDILGNRVEEGGCNYSVGERQLLNLGIAFLSSPSVIVLDEATASIDGETDAFIQSMLRTRFDKSTVITIAHRLKTIMDFDQIIVVDQGRAVEIGSPRELLEKNGVFAGLVDAAGEEGSKALRALVSGTS